VFRCIEYRPRLVTRENEIRTYEIDGPLRKNFLELFCVCVCEREREEEARETSPLATCNAAGELIEPRELKQTNKKKAICITAACIFLFYMAPICLPPRTTPTKQPESQKGGKRVGSVAISNDGFLKAAL